MTGSWRSTPPASNWNVDGKPLLNAARVPRETRPKPGPMLSPPRPRNATDLIWCDSWPSRSAACNPSSTALPRSAPPAGAAHGGEAGSSADPAGGRRAGVLPRLARALQKLDFNGFRQDERVDFLLFENHLDRELRRSDPTQKPQSPPDGLPTDESGIRGRPIGREALLVELAHEMIPYTPEELIGIARHEYSWCETELKRCSREMGFGDDWPKAVEKVKTMHVAPGEQPRLIWDLAWEAIQYVKEHDLVTIPALASETWQMKMMSPQRQIVNPFFTGGETISVSFPTDGMSHDAKLQSMRGNNIPFARATVHHEVIPGHHLQGFMAARERPWRQMFATPFWGEGWCSTGRCCCMSGASRKPRKTGSVFWCGVPIAAPDHLLARLSSGRDVAAGVH